MEASTRKRSRPAHGLVRKVLLPPLLAGAAVLCLLLAVAISFSKGAKADNPLAQRQTPDELAKQLTVDLEGTPTPADIARARKPLSERKRLLAAHPYFDLYKTAKRRFGVSWYLVAAVHYQETGFGEAPKKLAEKPAWRRHRNASDDIPRPTTYPNRTERHPSVKDDFDVVMAIGADLKAHAAQDLGDTARRALITRYGDHPDGRLATAMVVERARAWRLLGTLPLPGSGELATPVKGVVGGCGYFGCPRPGHLHNGVDFLAPTGTPIHSVEAGVVAIVESPGESGGYGNFVCIQHRPHLASCYAHMSAFSAEVRPGARVKRGQVIGLVGSTGSSTAPHLHFEIRRGPAECSACAVDPLPLLSGDVPDAALPHMADTPPGGVTGPTGPVAAVPTAPITQPPPTESAPEPEDEHPEPEAAPPPRNKAPNTTTGGTTTAPSRTTPAPAPQPAQPSEPAHQPAPTAQPQPAPTSTAEPGTGGTTPTTTPPPPPPTEPPPDPPTSTVPPG